MRAGATRVPGDDLALNNTGGSVADEAAQHEAAVRAAVEEAEARRKAEAETGANQVASQKKRSAGDVPIGTVVAGALRKPVESKYGPELPYPHGTPLNKQMKPCEGAEQPVYVSARVMGPTGWLVQRAVPVGEIQGADA